MFFRVTGPATPTDTPSSGRSPDTRARWRSRPPSRRLHSKRMAMPLGCPSSSCSSGSRERRHAGSTRPTATPRSAWRAEMSATTAELPRWAGGLWKTNSEELLSFCRDTALSSGWRVNNVSVVDLMHFRRWRIEGDAFSFTVDEGRWKWNSNPDWRPQPVCTSQHKPSWGPGEEEQSEWKEKSWTRLLTVGRERLRVLQSKNSHVLVKRRLTSSLDITFVFKTDPFLFLTARKVARKSFY